MSNEFDPKQFEKLCTDVEEVKSALMGNPDYRQKGALQRLDETEVRSWDNYHKINRIWYYAIGAGAVLALVFKGVEMALGS